MRLDQSEQLLGLKTGMRVDLFACWYLLGQARISENEGRGVVDEFGFRETFNGVGIFVYKEGQEYKIVAVEN